MGEAGLYNLVSFAGIFALMGVAWLLSADRKVINWRAVLWGTALQLLFALFIFVVPAGAKAFLFINDVVVQGARQRLGRDPLRVRPPGAAARGRAGKGGRSRSASSSPSRGCRRSSSSPPHGGPLLRRGHAPADPVLREGLLPGPWRISGAESLSVSSNIFVGVEANMTVLPHLGGMTRSEFCTILAAGMATTASNVLALYVLPAPAAVPGDRRAPRLGLDPFRRLGRRPVEADLPGNGGRRRRWGSTCSLRTSRKSPVPDGGDHQGGERRGRGVIVGDRRAAAGLPRASSRWPT